MLNTLHNFSELARLTGTLFARLLAIGSISLLSPFAAARLATVPLAAQPIPPLQALPHLSVDRSRVSISGVSSGAFMAVQMQVAHSSLIKGVGSIAGGVWECAKGNSQRAQRACMYAPDAVKTAEHIELANERAKRGEIDPIENLSTARVYIFASQSDMVIRPGESDRLAEFYEAFTPKASVQRDSISGAAHGFPTAAYGNDCGMMGSPWLLNCGKDIAGEILKSTGALPVKIQAPGTVERSSLIFFDQSRYASPDSVMYSWGAAYVPQSCRQTGTTCGIHIALHGCQMNPDSIDRQFIDHAGYNEWAETNQLVIIYPQAAKGTGNPYGCWDWFGFTGPDYTSKSGRQIKALEAILTAVGL